MSHLLLGVMGAFAQFERDLIRERLGRGLRCRSCAKGIRRAKGVSDASGCCREVQKGARDGVGHQPTDTV